MRCLVVGMGRFGSALCRELSLLGVEIFGADMDISALEANESSLTGYISLDASRKEELVPFTHSKFDAVFVCIGTPERASLITALLLKDLGMKPIYARSGSKLQEAALKACNIKILPAPPWKNEQLLKFFEDVHLESSL